MWQQLITRIQKLFNCLSIRGAIYILGWTPLHAAARYNYNPKVIQLLIDNGGDIHDKDNNGGTPLYLAAYKNNS